MVDPIKIMEDLIKENLIGTKRDRRRLKRQEEFGPEILVIKIEDGVEYFSCGHIGNVMDYSGHRGKKTFRRCIKCKEHENNIKNEYND